MGEPKPRKGGAPEGWGPGRVGPPRGSPNLEKVGPRKGGAPEGWGPRRGLRPGWALKGGAPKGGAPKGGAPKGGAQT